MENFNGLELLCYMDIKLKEHEISVFNKNFDYFKEESLKRRKELGLLELAIITKKAYINLYPNNTGIKNYLSREFDEKMQSSKLPTVIYRKLKEEAVAISFGLRRN